MRHLIRHLKNGLDFIIGDLLSFSWVTSAKVSKNPQYYGTIWGISSHRFSFLSMWVCGGFICSFTWNTILELRSWSFRANTTGVPVWTSITQLWQTLKPLPSLQWITQASICEQSLISKLIISNPENPVTVVRVWKRWTSVWTWNTIKCKITLFI